MNIPKMLLFSLIAQIQTGNSGLDYLINNYGALTTALILMLGLGGFVIWAVVDMRRKSNATETKREQIVNGLAERTTKLEGELREEQKARYIAEGRVNELSTMQRHDRDKFEEREKIWSQERGQLTEKVDKLSKRIETTEQESNGKTQIIQALELERDSLNSQLKDKDTELQGKQAQIERMQSNINALQIDNEALKQKDTEQAAQISSLAKQLAELDKTIFDTPINPMPVVTVPTAIFTENSISVTESNKELSAKSDESESKDELP